MQAPWSKRDISSVRQTPAIGQAVTLRTVFPQASRVVIPTRLTPHERRSIGMNEVKLKVLARGYVRDAIGILFRQLRHTSS
ncbi:MAG: hypothetical protein WKF37_11375 [Bryobacteraceae bacterium]